MNSIKFKLSGKKMNSNVQKKKELKQQQQI